MSSAGQIIGGVVGALAGFMIAGAAGALKGASIGMSIGGVLDPPKLPTTMGPRLTDTTMQTSTYGATIPRVYGTVPVVGNIFWLENNKLKEVSKKTKVSGKGGSKQTIITFSYFATFAVGLCQGPIAGIRRIWIGSKLLYDAGSSEASAVIASNNATALFTLHLGESTQAADARMQATVGIANTSAFRGLAYIVFRDLPLADYGNSLAGTQVKVEVMQTSSMYDTQTQQNIFYDTSYYAMACSPDISVAISRNGSIVTSRDNTNFKLSQTLPAYDWRDVAYNGKVFCAVSWTGANTATSTDGITWIVRTKFQTLSPNLYHIRAYNGVFYAITSQVGSGCFIGISNDAINWNTYQVRWPFETVDSVMDVAVLGKTLVAVINTRNYVCVSNIDNMAVWETCVFSLATASNITASDKAFFITSSANMTKGCYSTDGRNWSDVTMPSVDQKNSIGFNGEYFITGGVSAYTISKDLLTWSEARSYRIDIAHFNYWLWPQRSYGLFVGVNYNYSMCGTFAVNIQTPNLVSLASVIKAECLNAAPLKDADINVSAITKTVRGYKVSSIASVRSSIEILMGAYAFQIIQKGYLIYFVPRGTAPVATVTAAELSAQRSGA